MGPNFVLDKGYLATTTVAQFRAVTLTGNDKVKQADAAAQATLGISQELVNLASDVNERIINVRVLGISRCVAGAAGIARGTKVATDNVGRVVAATTGQAALGIMLTAGVAVGDHVDVMLTPGVTA